MDGKQSQTLSKIRQACCAGLPSRSFMPLVAAELRAAIPAAVCQFTWASESGRLVNFWSDTFMPRRTAWIILHHKRYEADAGVSFRELVLFGRPTGNLRAWWRNGFEASATYAAVFAPHGLKWFLDGVVRDAMRPYGCMALIRRHDEPDFSAAEEELLARVLPYIAHAMRVEAARGPLRFVRAPGRSALFVCDDGGNVIERSALAHQLAVLALVDEINLDACVEIDDFAEARRALGEIVGELRARLDGGEGGELPSLLRRNGWGEFCFRGYRLGAGRIGILIEQFVPFEAHLLERVNATGLTTRQKEVALLSARGAPNAEIAKALNITPQTLKDYFKSIYARLEVNCHRQLVERLSADAALH
jgi:DNA-binding CsgD family transcriptional regulator